jgi:hypothetical protein
MRREGGGFVSLFPFIPELAVLPQKRVIGLKKSEVKMNGCFNVGLAGFVIKALQRPVLLFLRPLKPNQSFDNFFKRGELPAVYTDGAGGC